MRSNLAAYAAGLLLTLTSGTAFAARGPATEGQFVKNGFPCFAEVCIGDRLEDLAELDLQPITPNAQRGVGANEMRRYADDFKAVYGTWDDAFFRGPWIGFASPELIRSAAQFENVCNYNFTGRRHYMLSKALQLSGSFRTASGYYTQVGVKLMPDTSDPQLRTRFFVTSLKRFIEVPVPEQDKAVLDAIVARYGKFMFGHSRGPIPTDNPWNVKTQVTAQTHSASRAMSRERGVEITIGSGEGGMYAGDWNRLLSHPRCQSTPSRGID